MADTGDARAEIADAKHRRKVSEASCGGWPNSCHNPLCQWCTGSVDTECVDCGRYLNECECTNG